MLKYWLIQTKRFRSPLHVILIFHFIILNVKPLGAVYVDQQFRVLLNAI